MKKLIAMFLLAMSGTLFVMPVSADTGKKHVRQGGGCYRECARERRHCRGGRRECARRYRHCTAGCPH